MFSQDFKEFVSLLIKHNVEYLVVGGYAVGVHGHPRYTGDLDIWINPTLENAENVIQCINEFGFGAFGLQSTDFTKIGNLVQLGYPPVRIDLLTEIDGVLFNECFKNKIEVEISNIKVFFIGYSDLIQNKKMTGRYKDLDDIEQLQ